MAAYTNIDDPSANFQTALYSGTGATQSITNDGNSDLQPDWIWWKRRDAAYSHGLVDSSRGTGKYLRSDSTNAEGTDYTYITSFDSDGFTIPSGDQSSNNSSGTYVAWQWKANGGTTSTNTDGDINSTVQVNATAGFSIVSYQPTNTTSRNIGHGLGVTPALIIIRNRTRIENWRVWHQSIGQGGAILDNTSAYNTSTSTLVNTVNSTIFNVGSDFSVNGNYPYIAYCFAEKQGYSKFGKYTGNGNANGAFVYIGFKPAFVMIKSSSATGSWLLWDNKRDVDNPVVEYLLANTASDESTDTGAGVDFCSNGFKVRSTGGSIGTSGVTYIYMAFAENPFVSSTGIPTTAV